MQSIPQGRSDADRRLRQAERLSRSLRVLQLIQGRGQWNAQSIAEELECSQRTVYRILNVLEFAGVPWVYDKRTQSYQIRSDYRISVPNLTQDELIGQAAVAVLAQATGLDSRVAATTDTEMKEDGENEISGLLNEAMQTINVLDLSLARQRDLKNELRTVQWSIIQRKQLSGRYNTPYQSRERKLRLHPYRLCLVKSIWYLLARPSDEENPKTYRISRFRTLRMLDSPCEMPEDFDIGEYFGNAWAVLRGDKRHDVEILFERDVANVVSETQWHHTQEIERWNDGRLLVRFRVDGLDEIVRWIISWADKATVLAPANLRSMVIDRYRRGIALNQDLDCHDAEL